MIDKLIKRLEHIANNPQEFAEEIKKVIKHAELRKEVAYFSDEFNLKETKFALETLFDKELSEGRKHEI